MEKVNPAFALQCGMGLPQGNQLLHFMVQGVRVRHLCLHRGAVRVFIQRNIKAVGAGAAETRIGGIVPLHGGTGAGALIAAFHGRQVFHIAHPDFIPIVNKRCAGHGKQEGKGDFQFVPLQVFCQPFHVMVAGGNADQPLSLTFPVIFPVCFYKFRNVAFSPFGEIRFPAAEQVIVMGGTEMQQEIHMETALQRFVWLAPFGYHGGIRKFFVQKGADALPKTDGSLTVLILFDQGACHVHAEAVTSETEPKAHDVFECLNGCFRAGGIHGLLPLALGIGAIESVIEGGLVEEEIDRAGAVTPGNAAQDSHSFRGFPYMVRPYITVGKGVGFRLHGFQKPRMRHGSVTGNKV